MDIARMNERLRALHGRIAIIKAYREQARQSGNDVLVFQYDREIRETQTEAQALQREIDGFNTPDVML